MIFAKQKNTSQDIETFETMMQEEFKEKPVYKTRKAIILTGIAGVVLVVIAIITAFILTSNANNAKSTKMEVLANRISAERNWEETRHENPSENSRGYLIREWKTTNQPDLDELASTIGVSMESVAYPSGCKEGTNGEFLIQLCRKADNRTISLVIG